METYDVGLELAAGLIQRALANTFQDSYPLRANGARDEYEMTVEMTNQDGEVERFVVHIERDS